MEHEQIKKRIEQHSIPKATVARIADVWATDLSAWLNGRQSLSTKKTERIATAVDDIIHVIETMPMKVDLRDSKNVLRLIQAVNDARLQMDLFNEDAEDTEPDAPPDVESLRVRPA
jgi:transcriptional regulator with XRE-family HTH domain